MFFSECPVPEKEKILVDGCVHCPSGSCPFGHDSDDKDVVIDGRISNYSKCCNARGKEVKNINFLKTGKIVSN